MYLNGILAVNLDHTGFTMADQGTGISFCGAPNSAASFGYAPWGSFSAAQSAIKALQGNITWSPSS